MTDVFDKLYEKYGKELNFRIISKKPTKIVYNMTTLSDGKEYIVMVVPNTSFVKRHKYMRSMGVQQQLFLNGMDVAEVLCSYRYGDDIIAVHEKLQGEEDRHKDAETMRVVGKVVGKMHRISSDSKYKKTILLHKNPNVFCRFLLFLRDVFIRNIPLYFKYFSLRNFPKGICHRDINGRNVLITKDGKGSIIDFDKYRYMPFVLAIVYFYNKHLKNKDLFASFMEGYCEERPLTKAEKAYLEKELRRKI